MAVSAYSRRSWRCPPIQGAHGGVRLFKALMAVSAYSRRSGGVRLFKALMAVSAYSRRSWRCPPIQGAHGGVRLVKALMAVSAYSRRSWRCPPILGAHGSTIRAYVLAATYAAPECIFVDGHHWLRQPTTAFPVPCVGLFAYLTYAPGRNTIPLLAYLPKDRQSVVNETVQNCFKTADNGHISQLFLSRNYAVKRLHVNSRLFSCSHDQSKSFG